jgi:predicted nucleic acid-binding protein
MKVQRVYTDTSVIGGCFDEEFAPWSNGLMKDFRLGNFEPVVSEIVTAEIEENAPEEVQERHRWLLGLGTEQLEVDDQVVELATAYVERGVLTLKYYDDALHVALASVHTVEVLVSWNFRHIVHFDKIRRFNAVNQELGYRTLEIRSPREVTNYGPEGQDI